MTLILWVLAERLLTANRATINPQNAPNRAFKPFLT